MANLSAPPNILIVLADDHQRDAIGSLNKGQTITPHLDRLLNRGTHFEETYIMGGLIPAVCSPSRACILTGQDPFKSSNSRLGNLASDFVRINETTITLPEWFRSHNYETHIAGKWHNDVPALLRSFTKGSHIFYGGMCDHEAVPLSNLDSLRQRENPRYENGFSSTLFADSTREFIKSRNKNKPFLAWLSLTSPHDPRTPPSDFLKLYDPDRLPVPENFSPNHPFDNGELHIRDEELLPRPLSQSDIRQEIARYYGMISHHDSEFGKVMDTLEHTGELDNTIVVYLSDHGLALGQHGLLGKQNLYQHSVRVPFIVAGPGVPRNSIRSAPIYSLDLFPLLCGLTHLESPDHLDSLPRPPSGFPDASFKRDSIFSFYKDIQRMVTDGNWKLIVYSVHSRIHYQLFNLEKDPKELVNLANSPNHSKELHRLKQLLNTWQQKTEDPWINRFQDGDF